MKNLLLLIQDEADAQNLSSAARWIIAHGVTTVWALLSPAVLVSTETATAAIDKEIEDLIKAKNAASARDDFDAAKGYSKQAEAKMLDKAGAVAKAHTGLSDDEKRKRTAALRDPFFNTLRDARVSVKFDRLTEHFETDNYLNLVMSLTKAWPAQMPHGTYGTSWARALTVENVQPVKVEAPAIPTEVIQAVKSVALALPKTMKPKVDPDKIYTGEELEKLAYFSLKSVAMRHEVWMEKQPKPETIRRILDAQAAKQLASM
jgi:hypothetical protein